MATRRVTTDSAKTSASAAPTDKMPSEAEAQTTSLLPTGHELLLFAAYPLLLLSGSIYSVLTVSPTVSPYNYITQSHDPATAPSYFAHKNNIFNLYFVKQGWFWTTAAFALLQYLNFSTRPPNPISSKTALSKPRALLPQALARYALATTFWIFMTQWSFGPALIDRTFALSGGTCDFSAEPMSAADGLLPSSRVAVPKEGVMPVSHISSGKACRSAGGTWKGGHDISGHVFLLILGSGLLVLESLPEVLRWAEGNRRSLGLGARVALGVAALKLWMLLMTAAYFHTWFEKLTGLLVALGALYTVYVLPRGVPGIASLFGQPA